MEPLYYLVLDNTKAGPYQEDELIDAGMERDTLVWFAGQKDWVRAAKVPELAELIKTDRKVRKQRRKERHQVARLPSPGLIRWLSRMVLIAHVPAAVLFLIGTTALLAMIVLSAIAGSGDPRLPPDPGFLAAARVSGLVGLLATGLSVPVMAVELVLIVVFVWNCRRVVRAISPEGMSSDFLDMFDFGGPLPFGLGIVLIALIFTTLFIGVYSIVALSIYRLAYGLNRVRDEYRLYYLPAAPVGLSFYTAMSGLLLITGPLSLPFFVMLPIWAYRTATTATEICESRREAVEGPPLGESAA
jgi:hypothetical protein